MSSSGISFSGLFSGLDTENIIEQLMQIERQPIVLLEQKQYKLGYEKEALQGVNSSLLALKNTLKTFAEGLSFQNDFSSEDESVVTGSADEGAAQGTYAITVTQLALNQIVKTMGEKLPTWGATAGVATITANGTGEVFTFNFAGGESLETVADMINTSVGSLGNAFSDYGTANILTNPISGDQIMTVSAAKTGTLDKLNYAGWAAVDMSLNNVQGAQNAQFQVDGIAYNYYENTVKDVIDGVTLNFHKVDGPVDVTIGLDDDSVVSKISDFVTQFNTTTDLLANYITEDKVDDPQTVEDFKKGILRGDFDLSSTKSQIRIMTTGYLNGGLADYKMLSQIGITSEASYGSYVSDNIEFDEDKLRAALADDKDQVASLLEGWADQIDAYLEEQTKVSVVEQFAGNYYRRILNIDDRNKGIDDDIANWEDRIAAMEERMRNQFSVMEQLLQQLQTQNTYLTAQLNNLLSASSTTKK